MNESDSTSRPGIDSKQEKNSVALTSSKSGIQTVQTGVENSRTAYSRTILSKSRYYRCAKFGLAENGSTENYMTLTAIHDYYHHSVLQRAQELLDGQGMAIDHEAMGVIVSNVLTYCIKDYDTSLHGGAFEEWLWRRICLTVESLKRAEWGGACTVNSHGSAISWHTTVTHRLIKNSLYFYKNTHNDQRESVFASWCLAENIGGATHEERVFAATIRYAPMIYRWLSEAGIDIDGSIVRSCFVGLNGYIWQYDPSLDEDFLENAKAKVMLRCSASMQRRKQREANVSNDIPLTVTESIKIATPPAQQKVVSVGKEKVDVNSQRDIAFLAWSRKNSVRGTEVKKIQGEMIRDYLPKVIKILFPHESILNESERSFAFTLLNIAVRAFHPSSDREDFRVFVDMFIENAKEYFSAENFHSIPRCEDHQTAAALLQAVNSGKYVPVVAPDDQSASLVANSNASEQAKEEELSVEKLADRLFSVAKQAVKRGSQSVRKDLRETLMPLLVELIEVELQICKSKKLPVDQIETHIDQAVRQGIVGLYLEKTSRRRR